MAKPIDIDGHTVNRVVILEKELAEAEFAISELELMWSPNEPYYQAAIGVKEETIEYWKLKAHNRKVCTRVLNRGLARALRDAESQRHRRLAAEARIEELETALAPHAEHHGWCHSTLQNEPKGTPKRECNCPARRVLLLLQTKVTP